MWEESGLELGYTNWRPREPNNHPNFDRDLFLTELMESDSIFSRRRRREDSGENCLEIVVHNNGMWNDNDCTNREFNPICQFKSNITSTDDTGEASETGKHNSHYKK